MNILRSKKKQYSVVPLFLSTDLRNLKLCHGRTLKSSFNKRRCFSLHENIYLCLSWLLNERNFVTLKKICIKHWFLYCLETNLLSNGRCHCQVSVAKGGQTTIKRLLILDTRAVRLVSLMPVECSNHLTTNGPQTALLWETGWLISSWEQARDIRETSPWFPFLLD